MRLLATLLCAAVYFLATYLLFAARKQEPAAMKKSLRLQATPLFLAGSAGMFLLAFSG